MIRKKVLVCITMCIAMAYNNFCFNVSANVIENTEQLNVSQNEENVDNKLKYYDDLNMSAGEILQKYNDDSSIDYHDIACSYEKEEKLLTFNKIAQIKDQLSSIELDVIKEYLFVYGTATNDRDIQKTYEYVISLLESNDERIISNSTNAIVNYANYNYKKESKNITKIKENDIIQEIILKHYLDNKKQTRKDILKTYFTNTNSKQKFRNKQEIENAIKSINDEMDEAQKEFSKLFISNDYTK